MPDDCTPCAILSSGKSFLLAPQPLRENTSETMPLSVSVEPNLQDPSSYLCRVLVLSSVISRKLYSTKNNKDVKQTRPRVGGWGWKTHVIGAATQSSVLSNQIALIANCELAALSTTEAGTSTSASPSTCLGSGQCLASLCNHWLATPYRTCLHPLLMPSPCWYLYYTTYATSGRSY